MTEIDRRPTIDINDRAQCILVRHWDKAREARDFHARRGRDGQIERALAGHQMQWLKAILRDLAATPEPSP